MAGPLDPVAPTTPAPGDLLRLSLPTTAGGSTTAQVGDGAGAVVGVGLLTSSAAALRRRRRDRLAPVG